MNERNSERVDAASPVSPSQNPRQHSEGQQRHDTLAEQGPEASAKTSFRAKTKSAAKSIKSALLGAVSIPVSGAASMFGSGSKRLGRVAVYLADIEAVDRSDESVVLRSVHATEEGSSGRHDAGADRTRIKPIQANVSEFSPDLPSHDLQRDRGKATDHLWKGIIGNLDELRIASEPLEHQRPSDSAQRRRQDQFMRSSTEIRIPREKSQEHFPQPRSPTILNQDGPHVTHPRSASSRNRHTKAMQLQSVGSSKSPSQGEPHPVSQPSRRRQPESQQSRSRGRGSQRCGAHSQYGIRLSSPATGESWKRGRQYMHEDSMQEEAESASIQQGGPPRHSDHDRALLQKAYAVAREATNPPRHPPTMQSLASSQSSQPQRMSLQTEMEPVPATSNEHQQASAPSKPWVPLRLN